MKKTSIGHSDNTGNVKARDYTFIRHKTEVNERGEVVYFAPIVIKDKADLANYGITWDDCEPLPFGMSERRTVYYYPTTNKEMADMFWKELNTAHSKGYRSTRCDDVPGKRKKHIVCPDTNKCSACPYGRKPEEKKAKVISLDGLAEEGCEFAAEDRDIRAAEARMTFEKVKVEMDKKDKNIAEALIRKEVDELKVKEIAEELGIEERQVYYCLKQARDIGERFKG